MGSPNRSSAEPSARSIRIFIAVAVAIAAVVGVALFHGLRAPTPTPVPQAARRVPALVASAPPAPAADPGAPDAGGHDAGPPRVERSGCGRTSPFLSARRLVGDGGQWVALLPRDYDQNTPYPLVVLLGDKHLDPAHVLEHTGFDRVGEERGFIVVASQHKYYQIGTEETWAPRVERHVREVDDGLCIDRERVFLVGHGAGANLATSLLCAVWVAGVARIDAGDKYVLTNQGCVRQVPYMSVDIGLGQQYAYRDCDDCQLQQTDLTVTTRDRFVKNACKDERKKTFSHAEGVCEALACEAPLTVCKVATEAFPPAAKYHGAAYADDFFPTAHRIWAFFEAIEIREDDEE